MKFILDAWHGDTSVWNKFESILLMWKSASNQPTRTITFEHDMLLAMHEMTPKLVSMWPCSWLAFMQNLKEFGHLTHIVSRSVSVLGFFSRENLSKCIKSQNSMKFIMDALHGDVSVSKKIGFILLVWNKSSTRLALPAYSNHHLWTWCASCHAWNNTNFCQHVSMLMAGLHKKFEEIWTPNARCITFG